MFTEFLSGCAPRHEVLGEVMEFGSEVKKFKVGDIVGFGGLVGSCG